VRRDAKFLLNSSDVESITLVEENSLPQHAAADR
jgi:hypothetical protein